MDYLADAGAEAYLERELHANPESDTDPVLLYEPPDLEYPERAKAERISGEVILQVVVRVDGTTRAIRVLRSVPYCNAAAIEHAERFRWTPAEKDTEPVDAFGVISVAFEVWDKKSK